MLVKNNTTITILILTVIIILVFGCSAIAQKGKCNGKNKPCPTPTPTITPTITPSPTLVPEALNAPALPAVFLTTEIVQQSGNEIIAGPDFQQALNQAVPGDTILLDFGKTYVVPSGGFILPEKPNPDNKWIYIKWKSCSNF
ncbi:MAG TPA: hypothetical protein PLP33_14660 [Leptospiraceae bacterium]|nr:hypothetical protein [Leptospiraceae bacterium]